MDSIHNTDISDSEIRSSKPIIDDSTNSSRRRLNNSLELGDSVSRNIPGGKTLEVAFPIYAENCEYFHQLKNLKIRFPSFFKNLHKSYYAVVKYIITGLMEKCF